MPTSGGIALAIGVRTAGAFRVPSPICLKFANFFYDRMQKQIFLAFSKKRLTN